VQDEIGLEGLAPKGSQVLSLPGVHPPYCSVCVFGSRPCLSLDDYLFQRISKSFAPYCPSCVRIPYVRSKIVPDLSLQKGLSDAYADDGLIEILGVQEGSDVEICLAQVGQQNFRLVRVLYLLFCGLRLQSKAKLIFLILQVVTGQGSPRPQGVDNLVTCGSLVKEARRKESMDVSSSGGVFEERGRLVVGHLSFDGVKLNQRALCNDWLVATSVPSPLLLFKTLTTDGLQRSWYE
jgi:hypothetical protein